jgi:nitric oxide reductase NorD protein
VNVPGSDGLERYRLLASAIAGRLVDVAPGVPGEPAWTDGTTIYVDAGANPRERLTSLAVQASLLGAGSLDADVVRALVRRPAVARRYLAIEGHRALAAQEALLPVVARPLIDRTIAARTGSPAASLSLAASGETITAPPEVFGVIRTRQLRATAERAVDDRTPTHVPRRQRDDVLRDVDDDEPEDGSALDVLSSPVGGSGAIGRLLKRLFRDTRSEGGGPPGADAPTHRTRRSVGASRSTALTTARPTPPGEVAMLERHETTYPEWDTFRRRYRPSWCTVVPVESPPTDATPLTPAPSRVLRRSLARLGIGLERTHRQLQGDDVDIDAAVEAYVEARAGSAPDEAVYVDSVRRRRELAVLVLLDVSGSAGEPGAAGATVHEHQRSAANALTVALHDLGDRVALYAFRSYGRSAVEVVRVKRFDDALDAAALQRLGGLVPAAYTRLGAAIRHGASVLERNGGTQRRLLVVLSDGFAYDHGYEGAYGEADARRALAEARRRGTGCLCLSIGAATDAAALRRVFGSAAHASIPRVEQLADVVGPLFRSALGSADVQRRVWQRTTRTRERLHLERSSA